MTINIVTASYTKAPSFKGGFANDKETKAILKKQIFANGSRDIFFSQMLLKQMPEKDVVSIREYSDDSYVLTNLKNGSSTCLTEKPGHSPLHSKLFNMLSKPSIGDKFAKLFGENEVFSLKQGQDRMEVAYDRVEGTLEAAENNETIACLYEDISDKYGLLLRHKKQVELLQKEIKTLEDKKREFQYGILESMIEKAE